MRPRRLTLMMAVALVCAICAGTAAAAAGGYAIPGATYAGKAADGALVTITISSDGTLVTSYRITDASAGSCQFYGEGDSGAWQGSPIVNNAFVYNLGDALSFKGSFPSAQAASGTFEFREAATSATAACDTGVVSWTATTAAGPTWPSAWTRWSSWGWWTWATSSCPRARPRRRWPGWRRP